MFYLFQISFKIISFNFFLVLLIFVIFKQFCSSKLKVDKNIVIIRLQYLAMYEKMGCTGYWTVNMVKSSLKRLKANSLQADNGNENVTGLALLDLSAAFNTVDHAMLLHHLFVSYHIAGRALNWFASYLRDRTQCVQYQVRIIPCSIMEYHKTLSSVRSYSSLCI